MDEGEDELKSGLSKSSFFLPALDFQLKATASLILYTLWI